MITDLRKFLASRIKLYKTVRDMVLREEEVTLINDITKPLPEASPELKYYVQIVDELTRVANFLDFIPREITEETPNEKALEVASNLMFREFLEWLETTPQTWNDLEERLDNKDLYSGNISLEESTFRTLAIMAKNWYKEVRIVRDKENEHSKKD